MLFCVWWSSLVPSVVHCITCTSGDNIKLAISRRLELREQFFLFTGPALSAIEPNCVGLAAEESDDEVLQSESGCPSGTRRANLCNTLTPEWHGGFCSFASEYCPPGCRSETTEAPNVPSPLKCEVANGEVREEGEDLGSL
ncbi:unnamed protein product, partial [Protopolystoma xenopodis]